MNIALIVIFLMAVFMFVIIVRNDPISKALLYLFGISLLLFEMLFLIFHPLVWLIHIVTLIFAFFSYSVLIGIRLSITWLVAIYYTTLPITVLSVIFVLIEALFGRLI